MAITIETPTAEAVFEMARTLSAPERFRLASMIIGTIAPQVMVDQNTEWSDEDLRDFSLAGAALYEQIEAEEVQRAATG